MNQPEWYIILNPMAANGRAQRVWPELAKLLKISGLSYEMVKTQHRNHAKELVAEGTARGFYKIIAIGGDGINNEVINGIFLQKYIPTQKIEYTLIPVGTGNDWSRTHQIPMDYHQWIPQIKQPEKLKHDIGLLSYFKNGIREERYFINVAGLAYDGYLCKKMSEKKDFTNKVGFLWLTLKELFKYKLRPAKVIFDKTEIIDHFYTINIGICRYSGGGMQFVPHAIPDDGLLALTVAGPLSKWNVMLNSWRFYNGTIPQHSLVKIFQTKEVIIETVGKLPTEVEVDGEYLGTTPVRCIILEKALTILRP